MTLVPFNLIFSSTLAGKGQKSYASLKLIVEDVNDNSPYFVKHLTNISDFMVEENSKPNTTVFKATVDDKDAGSNGQV